MQIELGGSTSWFSNALYITRSARLWQRALTC